MGFLLNLIPGFSAGKLIAIGAAILALIGFFGYLKYENVQLQNSVLTKQNQLDNAKNVIVQEKEANDTLVKTIEQKKKETVNIIKEQTTANTVDNKVQAVKDKHAKVLEDGINEVLKKNVEDNSAFDEAREKWLQDYQKSLDCKMENPNDLTACQ